ncbi:MAG: hypothetical protein AB4038_11205 [Prochloraceae cyanobacterium]
MKKPNSSNRIFELDRQLTKNRPSPPPSSLPPSPSGSGFLFNLEKAVQQPQERRSLQKPPRRQVRSFDDGQPIEIISNGDAFSPMVSRAFDFDEPIAVQQEDYAEASSWDGDIAESDVPFQAQSFETEDEVFPGTEFASEDSPHSDALAREVEALRQEVRSLRQTPAPTAHSSPQSAALEARLQEIRDQVQQLQWQKQQPPERKEVLADRMVSIRDELRSMRQDREAEALSQEYWQALELEPTFQDFDQQMEEEYSPSLSEAAQHVPVEVVPPEAPDPQAKAMELELSEQFTEFDQMMDAEAVKVTESETNSHARQLENGDTPTDESLDSQQLGDIEQPEQAQPPLRDAQGSADSQQLSNTKEQQQQQEDQVDEKIESLVF